MGDDAGGGVGDGAIDVDGGFALVENGVDEFVGEKGMGALVAAVVAERGGQHVRCPPLFLLIPFEHRGLAGEAAGVLFRKRAPLDRGRAHAVGVGVEEAHFVTKVLGAFDTLVRALPPDGDTEAGAAVRLEKGRFVPERVFVDVVLEDGVAIAPADAGGAGDAFAGDA